MKVFEDFVKFSDVREELIYKYTDILPVQIIDVWKEYGFGSFCKGLCKLINPDDFQELFNKTYVCQQDTKGIPILTTGMGDIIYCEEEAPKSICVVKYRYGLGTVLSSKKGFFDKMLLNENLLNQDLGMNHYLKGINLLGTPDYDECFGYTPLLGAGGKEKPENMNRIKIKEHIMIINEFSGAAKW